MINASFTRFADIGNTMPYSQQNTFCVAELVFQTNLQSADGDVLPLGIIGEVNAPHIRGFGLLARTTLTEAEMKRLDRLSSRLLSSPIDFLGQRMRGIFTRMNENDGLRGHLVDELQCSLGSIVVQNRVDLPVAASWLVSQCDEIYDDVREQLRAQVTGKSKFLRAAIPAMVKTPDLHQLIAESYEESLQFAA